MKIQEGDYVDVSGMNEAERRDVVQALLYCGVGEGEGFRYAHSGWGRIGFYNGGIYYDDDAEFLNGRKLTLSDLRSPEWYGNGLPPVGVECEYVTFGGEKVRSGVVAAHIRHENGDISVVMQYPKGGWDMSTDTDKFRPIKTEREKAIEQACDIFESSQNAKFNANIDCSAAIRAVIETLIDSGYKKETNL